MFNHREKNKSGDMPNIIMILLDGLRRDRIHNCQFLLSVLNKGYYFSNTITAAPYTLASMHSIFSGLYPSKNGVNSYFGALKFKKSTCKTLPQYLQENGYYTIANLVNDFLIPSQGFNKIDKHDEFKDDLLLLHKDIISKIMNQKFFLFLQYSNIHTETIRNVGKKYTDFDEEYFKNYKLNKNNYNSYLKKMDLYLKEIFNHIESLNLLRNTIIVVFSDHGTSNGEKIGEKMYGSFTYDYTIRVFCTFLMPSSSPKEIKTQVRTIDIMPTLLEFLDIKLNDHYEKIQGQSLMPLIEDKQHEDRISFSETGGLNGPWPSPYEPNVFCIRFKNFKLIYNKTPDLWEMYNLDDDPEEKNNIFNENDKFALELKKMLLSHLS